MARKKKGGGGGGGAPEWLVTFADLMSLLVCFFVLIISFSIQDQEKLQVVAGSMRDAFGVQYESRKRGVIEVEGLPTRDYMREVSQHENDNDSQFASLKHDQNRKQGPEAVTHEVMKADRFRPQEFSSAAASLRQAWQALPEISEVSQQVMMEETPDGLNIQLVDQDGRSMFAPGAKEPYEYTRQLLIAMAPVIAGMPNRIQITGHSDAIRVGNRPNYSQWELTADRANSARKILSAHGIAHDRFHSVVGKADSEPLFPDNPYLAANRRVSILLMTEPPPVPPNFRP